MMDHFSASLMPNLNWQPQWKPQKTRFHTLSHISKTHISPNFHKLKNVEMRWNMIHFHDYNQIYSRSQELRDFEQLSYSKVNVSMNESHILVVNFLNRTNPCNWRPLVVLLLSLPSVSSTVPELSEMSIWHLAFLQPRWDLLWQLRPVLDSSPGPRFLSWSSIPLLVLDSSPGPRFLSWSSIAPPLPLLVPPTSTLVLSSSVSRVCQQVQRFMLSTCCSQCTHNVRVLFR